MTTINSPGHCPLCLELYLTNNRFSSLRTKQILDPRDRVSVCKIYQAIPPNHPCYGLALQILGRAGKLDFIEKNEQFIPFSFVKKLFELMSDFFLFWDLECNVRYQI